VKMTRGTARCKSGSARNPTRDELDTITERLRYINYSPCSGLGEIDLPDEQDLEEVLDRIWAGVEIRVRKEIR
jgi:fumarate hydratase class II